MNGRTLETFGNGLERVMFRTEAAPGAPYPSNNPNDPPTVFFGRRLSNLNFPQVAHGASLSSRDSDATDYVWVGTYVPSGTKLGAVKLFGRWYAGFVPGVDPPGFASLWKLDAETGEVIWSYDSGGNLYDLVLDEDDAPIAVGDHSGMQNYMRFPTGGYWRMNEESGPALDYNDVASLADFGGVGAAAGNVNGARQFNGAEYFRTALSTVGVDSELTIGVWVYLDANDVDMPILYLGGASAGQLSYRLDYNAEEGAFVFAASSDGTAVTQAMSATDIAAESWYFVTCYHDRGTSLGIQIDAGDIDEVPFAGGFYAASIPRALYVGHDPIADTYLSGRVDELGLWIPTFGDPLLRPPEIDFLYNDGNGRDDAPWSSQPKPDEWFIDLSVWIYPVHSVDADGEQQWVANTQATRHRIGIRDDGDLMVGGLHAPLATDVFSAVGVPAHANHLDIETGEILDDIHVHFDIPETDEVVRDSFFFDGDGTLLYVGVLDIPRAFAVMIPHYDTGQYFEGSIYFYSVGAPHNTAFDYNVTRVKLDADNNAYTIGFNTDWITEAAPGAGSQADIVNIVKYTVNSYNAWPPSDQEWSTHEVDWTAGHNAAGTGFPSQPVDLAIDSEGGVITIQASASATLQKLNAAGELVWLIDFAPSDVGLAQSGWSTPRLIIDANDDIFVVVGNSYIILKFAGDDGAFEFAWEYSGTPASGSRGFTGLAFVDDHLYATGMRGRLSEEPPTLIEP